MTRILAIKYFSSSETQPYMINISDGSTEVLGGSIERDPSGEILEDYNQLKNSYIVSDGVNVYCQVSDPGNAIRWYKYFRTAQYLQTAATMTTGLPSAGETVTGGTSGATGTLIENVYSGDDYLKFIPVSGTFQDGEALSFSAGAATPNTAASGALTTNRGGEWGVFWDSLVDDSLESNGTNGAQISGLHIGINSAGNRCVNTIFQDDAGDDFQWVSYDIVTDTVTVTEIQTESDAFSTGGNSLVVNNVLYHTGLDTGNVQLVTVDIGTGASTFAEQSMSVGGTWSSGSYKSPNLIEWNGRIFLAMPVSGSYYGHLLIYEVTGGSFTLRYNYDDNGNSIFKKSWPDPLRFVGTDDNALYLALMCSNGTNSIYAWNVLRFIMESDGTILAQQNPDCSFNSNHAENIAYDVLPADILSIISNEQTRFFTFVDSMTEASTVCRFIMGGEDNGDPMRLGKYVEWSQLNSGTALVWDGTTTVVATGVDITSSTPANDWIRHDTSNRMFRITATTFTGGNTEITIENEGEAGNSIPSTDSVSSKPAPWTLTTTNQAGLADSIMPHYCRGGGDYTYNEGDIARATTPQGLAYTADALSMDFTIEEGAAIATTHSVSVIGKREDGTKKVFTPTACVVKSGGASAGTIVSNEVTGLTDGVEYTITVGLSASSVVEGEKYDIFIKVDFS